MSDRDDFEAWLQQGIDSRWVTSPCCATHEWGALMSEDEAEQWREFAEVCIPTVRLLGLERTL